MRVAPLDSLTFTQLVKMKPESDQLAATAAADIAAVAVATPAHARRERGGAGEGGGGTLFCVFRFNQMTYVTTNMVINITSKGKFVGLCCNSLSEMRSGGRGGRSTEFPVHN